ncbi:MAG TPA: GGDEF domain-containing protein [Gemmatimonadales bacterium]|jgi:diguanylate cyclase (GGDEF)-like protein|nr:GGDEF domain-containing protein [Gemmatimonadales bacterium]
MRLSAERRSGADRRTGPRRRSGLEPLRSFFPLAQFDERDAADRSAAIEAHRRTLSACLGRNVGLPVAALDYLSNIRRDLVAPTIIERGTLEVLERRSVTDPLTGLFNRYHFEATLTREVARCARSATWVSLLLMDVDQLKAVNDRRGHQAGDGVLKRVAAAIRDSLRTADTAARYGGDEFAVILPDTNALAGRLVAERICAKVAASLEEETTPGAPIRGTVSVGLAASSVTGSSTAEVQLFVAADRALYMAKGRGGNCVVEEV